MATNLLISPAELQRLRALFEDSTPTDQNHFDPKSKPFTTVQHNVAAFRAALRVYLATWGGVKGIELLADRFLAGKTTATPRPKKSLVASKSKLALSLSSLLFFHRVLFRIFSRIRLQLLHEKVRNVRQRYPKIYKALTSRITPAIGASLSGFALGLCPADQLRVTITLYVGCRALELLYGALEEFGHLKNKPWWLGSWLLFPLAQGQLLHAFVFDRDCFPKAYGTLIINHTPEYIQRRPVNLSSKVEWPTTDQIVDAIAEMARLKWPAFVSPILHPNMSRTLPPSIDHVISPITSRAHPVHNHLSCALLHPSQPSCFAAYLHHNLISFPSLTRFFALYYGALSIFRLKELRKSPLEFLNRLSQQILRTALAIGGAIGVSWGSICFFQNLLPRTFLSKFRFFLGGLMGGMFQFFDRTAAGHANALYAGRTSVDSLWKVGKKHKWWKGVKAGDVWLFVVSLAIINSLYDVGIEGGRVRKDRSMALIKLMRGQLELGKSSKPSTPVSTSPSQEGMTEREKVDTQGDEMAQEQNQQ